MKIVEIRPLKVGVCKGCGYVGKMKKEKTPKGQPNVYYCPKCSLTQ